MSPARIAILSLAVVVAISLAVIVHSLAGAKRPVAAAAAAQEGGAMAPVARVLVVKRDLPIGARLAAEDLGWQPWPAEGLNAGFVAEGRAPAAQNPGAAAPAGPPRLEDFVGMIVREALVAGEPLLPGKLVRPGGGGGELAMVLPQGMQALQVPVKTENGTGSFIRSGDRVDVRQVDRPGTSAQSKTGAQTVLRNVRVLSFEQAKRPDGTLTDGWVATLEVDAVGGDALAGAMARGDLHLALRSFADERAASGLARRGPDIAERPVRIISQGETQEVLVTQ